MVERLSADKFLNKALTVPIVDVRAPLEFARGHIPGATNIPLFDDLERAEVGTLYNKAGRDEAITKGMEIAGARMKAYVERARELASNGEILVYCWRGGMRSESMAWLFSTAGITTFVLEKGYKGFRNYIHDSFHRQQPMAIIGGMTGSGKTELLKGLAGRGAQVIDLEALARHKGSVFGNLGLPEQPTNEHFENLLGMEWLALDPVQVLFVEDESINIGRDSIPKPLFDRMQHAPMYYIDMPVNSRVDRLFDEYAAFPKDELKRLIEKISRRLGGDRTREAVMAVEEDRLRDAISISLAYYDKAYNFGVEKREAASIIRLEIKDSKVEGLLPEIDIALP